MNENDIPGAVSANTSNDVQAFYNVHPYPPPVIDLDGYRASWQDEGRRRADYHLFWPAKSYREELHILVAGCGTSQAAKYALRHPSARIVGIDISTTSIQETGKLKHQYDLANLELVQLPIERVEELDQQFDKIICTGVLHHLPDPDAGLQALREVLNPDGAMHLMVYAAYGRVGVYMLQEYVSRLGIGDSSEEIRDLASTLMALPREHPLARLLGESPDFRSKSGLADALLNPLDRAYTVPELLELISAAGLQFGRWLRQAPYLPQCGAFVETPHGSRLAQLPPQEQYIALELLRGNLVRHSAVLYRSDHSEDIQGISFDGERWQGYIPIRLPGTIIVQQELPAGAAAVLINPNHTYPDIFLPVDETQLRIYESIDGERTIADIMAGMPASGDIQQQSKLSPIFFEQLWCYDQVIFDASKTIKL